MKDVNEQSFLWLWQMPVSDLKQMSLYLSKRMASFERRGDYKRVCEFAGKKVAVTEMLAKRIPR